MQYALSNLAMYGGVPYLLLSPISYQISLARSAGYDGLEWFPLRFPFGYGRMPEAKRQYILAFHQSYLGELSLKEAIENNKKNSAALPSYLIMQHRYHSMTYIARYERQVFNDEVPVVIYPPEHFEFASFPQRFQIIGKIVKDWGLSDIQELIRWAEKQSLRFVFDTNHSRNIGLGHWSDVIKDSIDMIDEIHIRTGHYVPNRTPEQLASSVSETKDTFEGDFNSELAEILRLFKDLKWDGLVTIEIPTSEILKVAGIKSSIVLPITFRKVHSQLLANIKSLLE